MVQKPKIKNQENTHKNRKFQYLRNLKPLNLVEYKRMTDVTECTQKFDYVVIKVSRAK